MGIIGLGLGCSPARHYRTLSFFLDGVPDPNAPVAVAAAEPDGPSPSGRPSRPQRIGPGGSVHKPVLQRDCGACHQYSVDKPGTAARGTSLLTTYRTGGNKSNLAQPIRLLCVGCHTAYGPETAVAEGLWLHGPVGAGACTFCHEQHDSPYRKLLRAPKPRELCLQCHMETDLRANDEHPELEDIDDCIDCHDPHRGDSRFLL